MGRPAFPVAVIATELRWLACVSLVWADGSQANGWLHGVCSRRLHEMELGSRVCGATMCGESVSRATFKTPERGGQAFLGPGLQERHAHACPGSLSIPGLNPTARDSSVPVRRTHLNSAEFFRWTTATIDPA